MKRVLILGIGNILLQDEGVGVHAVNAMRGMRLPGDVELLDGGTSGADLVDFLAGRPRVIVIDAVDSGSPPGTVFRMTARDLLGGQYAKLSLHQLGLVDSLEMARLAGDSPGEVVIYGIQPERVDWGLELTETVSKVMPKVIDLVLREAGAGDSTATEPAITAEATGP